MKEKLNLKEEKIKLAELFLSFFKLGLFTIGGGMAMIPLIQDIVVEKKKWMTEEECLDCIAVSQGLPGVIAINMATYIGNCKRGFIGAITATAGIILPSLMVIIMVVELLESIGSNTYVIGALKAIKAAAAALIACAAWRVGKQALKNTFQWMLMVGSFVMILFLNINAIFFILAGILLGIVYNIRKEVRK